MSDMTEIARGLRFPEGPMAMADGSVVLVEMFGPRLTRVHRHCTTRWNGAPESRCSAVEHARPVGALDAQGNANVTRTSRAEQADALRSLRRRRTPRRGELSS